MFIAHPSKDPLLMHSMSQIGKERAKMFRTRKVYLKFIKRDVKIYLKGLDMKFGEYKRDMSDICLK